MPSLTRKRHAAISVWLLKSLGIYPIDTVRQSLGLFGELAGLRGRELAGQIEQVASALRLDDLLERKAGELSGGQKRRLHTAIALLNRPKLILLDEATTGADVETRAALIDVVKDLARDGSAVLYSTHYLHEVEALDARVVILDRGIVIADGPVRNLVSSMGGTYVELTFDGPPPALGGDFVFTTNGQTLRVSTGDPGKSLGRILADLGPEAGRLQNVEIINSNLETVFMALTGRRFEREEVANVGAS